METYKMQDWTQVFDFRFIFLIMSSAFMWLAENVDVISTLTFLVLGAIYGIYGIVERHNRIIQSKESHQKEMNDE